VICGFVVICRFVMIYGFVNSLTWLILMVQAHASEISNARHLALGVSIVQSLVLYFVYWFFVRFGQFLLNWKQQLFFKN
jgi:hypothetical protein